ncbi:MAG: ATP-binding protein [bacterium]
MPTQIRAAVAGRLEGLMLFRVVIVTIFLGTAVALDAESLVNLAEFRNATLLVLIVSTYVLTIAYAIALKLNVHPVRHAVVQLSVDFMTSVALALVTSGLDSLFLFLFYVIVINAAVVLGRPAALAAAAVSTAAFVLFAAIDLGWVTIPNIYGIFRPAKVTVFRLAVNSTAAFVVAVLAGYLADRLGKATAELVRQRSDFADLKALNINILESLSSGLVTTDLEGQVIFVNQAAEHITGVPGEHMMNRPIDAIFPGLWEALQSPQPLRRRESAFERTDGTPVFLGFSVSPLTDASGNDNGHIVIFQDLTDIRELESQMRRSERLAAIGQLSAAIAHEIRNPLASISGAVEMLEGESESDSDRALMGIVIREVDRLNVLISDFLEYCRPHNLTIERADLMPVIEEVLALARTRGHLSVEVEGPDRVMAELDSQATRQIIWNLLNNAAEAGADRVRLAIVRSEEKWWIDVEDNGPGVEIAIRDHIFEPFFTTKPKGTGLGLATIFRLMEEQSGSISLTDASTLGGACFRLVFAVASASSTESGSLRIASELQQEVIDG